MLVPNSFAIISLMKIIIIVADSNRKNLVFSVNSLRAYSLDESIKLAKEAKLELVHTVKTGQWFPAINLSNRPEIIGTLYNQRPRTPNAHPRSSDRGRQIHAEFYPFARNILK